MTEAEAKTKWCPHTGVVATFEPRSQMSGTRCIASDCMAWRTAPVRVPDPADDLLTVTVRGGYCGLAGPAQ